ncbi:MAG TPA: hypothetical protein PKH02_01495, partial [Bacteroidales bacterium]|nr:hypothetical protein [Bacteroidales bacterium]
METHEESSPEGLWNDLEEILRKEKDRVIVPPVLFGNGRLILLSKQIGTAAAIALVVLSIGYFSLDKNHEKDLSTVTQIQQKEQDKSEIKSASSEKNPVRDNLISLNIIDVAAQIEPFNAGQPGEYSSSEKREDFTINTGNDKKIEEINIKPPLRSSECIRPFKNAPVKYYDYMYAYNSTTDKDMNSNKKCNLSAFASNLPVSIQSKYNGAKDFSAANIDIESVTGVRLLGEDPYTDILIYNKYVETQTSIKHKQPVTGGLTFNYSLNRHWG